MPDFQAHRADIERLTSAKHSACKFKKDGTVRVTSLELQESETARQSNWEAYKPMAFSSVPGASDMVVSIRIAVS